MLGPSNLNLLVAKFPIQQNREFNRENSEFFLRNREAYADKSEDDDGASDGGAKLFAEPPLAPHYDRLRLVATTWLINLVEAVAH